MLRRAMTTFDLTGDWEGHYLQRGGKHGIAMRVVQRGQSFAGGMRDVDTLLASHETMRLLDPAHPERERVTTLEVLMSLPEHSTVEGEVEGRVVIFVKSYRGTSTADVRLADGTSRQIRTPGHQVRYAGTLDASGNVLSGHWSIPPGQRDHFELRRVAATVRAAIDAGVAQASRGELRDGSAELEHLARQLRERAPRQD